MATSNKYLLFWKENLPEILKKIHEATKTNETQGIILRRDDFETLGNRPASGYSFRLDISNGFVPRKEGSSVARDLKIVLDNSKEFIELAENRELVIRMGKDFVLEITPR